MLYGLPRALYGAPLALGLAPVRSWEPFGEDSRRAWEGEAWKLDHRPERQRQAKAVPGARKLTRKLTALFPAI